MLFFSNPLVGQLVVLALVLCVTLRPLLKKSRNLETVSILAIISFCLNILLILIFGLSVFLLISQAITLFVLITNIASIYRLSQGLYSDRHNTLFCVVSYIEASCVLICIVFFLIFKPVSYNTDIQKRDLYTGSFSRGFVEKDSIIDKTNIIITEYSLSNSESPEAININESDIVVVYLSPIGVTSSDSALRLSTIAELGVPVLAGDFYAPDAPKTGTSLDSKVRVNPVITPYVLHFLPTLQEKQKEAFLSNKDLELETLLSIAGQKYTSVLIIAEGENRRIALSAQQKYPGFVRDVFSSTDDPKLNDYYGENIADLALLNPFDAYLGKFDSAEEYREHRLYANTEKPHLRFARQVVSRIEEITQE